MKLDGRCHCGEIRFEAEANPENVIACHCTDCQTISGAPFRVNIPVLTRNLRLTGEPKRYAKRGDSGEDVTTTFCPTCGSAIFSCKGPEPEFVWLRLGIVNQRAELPPKRQGFCRSALPWAFGIADVPRI